MAQNFWEAMPLEADAAPAPAAAPSPAAGGSGGLEWLRQPQPKAPPPQTPEQARNDQLTNERIERDMNKPIPVPGSEGWFIGPDGKPYKMQLPDESDPVKKAIGSLNIDNLLFSVDRAKTALGSGWGTTGVTGAIMGVVPGSSRNDLLAQLESLKGGAILEKLQALKEASATGASGMGALSEREGDRLAASIAALSSDMSDDELRLSLNVVDRHMRALKAIGDGANPEDPAAQEKYGIRPLAELSKEPVDPAGQGDIGFNQRSDPRVGELTPAQNAAYQAWWGANPNPTPEQLTGFLGSINVQNVSNAGEIIAAYKAGDGISATTQINPDISDARGKDNVGERANATLRGALDTLTVGTRDNIKAAAETLIRGGSYDENLARQGAIDAYDEENYTAQRLTGQIAGGLVIPTGVANAARVAASQAIRAGLGREAAKQAARQAAGTQLAKEGAAYGGTYGAASSDGDNIIEVAADAAVGAATGGLTGKATPTIGAGVATAARAVAPAFGRGTALADQVAFKAIRADGTTAKDLARGSARANELGVPYMVADSGRTLAGLCPRRRERLGKGASPRLMR